MAPRKRANNSRPNRVERRADGHNIPSVPFNPPRRYVVSFNNQDPEMTGGFSGTITYAKLYQALIRQLYDHKQPPLQELPAETFPIWRNIRLLKARGWGVPFVSGAQANGVKFSIILVPDAQAKPSVEVSDFAAGNSDRPYGTVKGGPLNWARVTTKDVGVITVTDCDVLHCLVEVW